MTQLSDSAHGGRRRSTAFGGEQTEGYVARHEYLGTFPGQLFHANPQTVQRSLIPLGVVRTAELFKGCLTPCVEPL